MSRQKRVARSDGCCPPYATECKITHDALVGLGDGIAQVAQVYEWPLDERPRDANGHHGSLHVKCAVADESAALISSANLTEFALNLNMEMGVLVRGGELPRQVASHLTELIDAGVLRLIH